MIDRQDNGNCDKVKSTETKNNNDTNPLFSECLESLGNETLIFSQEKKPADCYYFNEFISITVSGKNRLGTDR